MRVLLLAAQCALLACLSYIGTAFAEVVDTIIIKGSKFFYETNGTEFFIKGVAYQQNGYYATYTSGLPIIDPFSDGPTCARDIPYLIDASINVVRAYAVVPENDHSACMAELADAGIYVLMDLTGNQKDQKINITAPFWDYLLYDQMTSVVDAFHNYTNVLGFFVGTEVINSTYTYSAPYVKAAARDVKAYIKKKNYRSIPVGYAMSDDSEVRQDTAAYLNCGSNQVDAIDFLGLNLYSWCGDSTLTRSGYSDRIDEFQNYSIPIFLSEFGCSQVSPRRFTEVQAIYGDTMAQVFSGGIVYQYFHDNAEFGLVDVYGDSVTTSADYSYLSRKMATATPSGVGIDTYHANNTAQGCPTTNDVWLAAPTLPPTPYARLCQCMMESLTCISPQLSNDTSIGDFATSICASTPSLCAGISSYTWNGTYGAFSVCNSTELASWVLNEYYESEGSNSSTCDSLGGIIQTPVREQASDCANLLQQAGVAGTGTITSTPSPPAAAATENSSGSGSNAGNSNNGTTTTQIGGSSAGGNNGLSGGAIAGIVVGVIAVLAIIATLAFFLWRAHRKNRPAELGESARANEPSAELSANEKSRQEAGGNPRSEADGAPVTAGGVTEYYKSSNSPSRAAELQGNPLSPVELDAPHGVNEMGGIRSPTDTGPR